MLGWKKYRAEVKSRAAEMRGLVPEVMKGYAALAGSGGSAKHLDAKTRELISLAVAVTTRCDGCIASHVEAAVALGVTQEELAEALGVAMAMNAGAALVYSTRALDCFAEMSSPASS